MVYIGYYYVTISRIRQLGAADFTSGLVVAAQMQDAERIQLCLQRGGDPNVLFGKTTALIEAATKGDTKIIGMLLSHGANPNLRADGGPSRFDESSRGRAH